MTQPTDPTTAPAATPTEPTDAGPHAPLAPPLLEDDQDAPPRPEEDLADVERSDPEPHGA